MFNHLGSFLFVCLLALVTPALAQTDNRVMDSGWLDLVKGSRDDTTGAQLMDIGQDDEEGSHKVTVAIPKSAMGDPDAIEEVLVVGKAPQKGEPIPLPDVRYEWVKDYDEDNYGLIIHLGDGDLWPIRLQMYATPSLSE